MKITTGILAGVAAIALPGAANAALVININQVGANVVATGSGSFNTTGLSAQSTDSYTVLINGLRAALFVGTQTNNVRYNVGLTTGPSFGTSNVFYYANSSAGDTFGLYGTDGAIHLPIGYVSGTNLSGSSTYNNLTLAGMGLVNGTYVYTSANDRVTVNIGAAAVPEPASWAMMIMGMGAVGGVMRRRAKVTTKVAYA